MAPNGNKSRVARELSLSEREHAVDGPFPRVKYTNYGLSSTIGSYSDPYSLLIKASWHHDTT